MASGGGGGGGGTENKTFTANSDDHSHERKI